jgi:hypothetical protein
MPCRLLGLEETAAIRLVFMFHLLNALAFLLGWRTRVAAVCLWMTNLIMSTSGSPYLYGFDTFANIALFYCMFAPVGSALSCDRIAGRTSGTPSFAARLSLRVLQAHLALVYAASGIEKASGIQWWNGEALWRSWMRADLGTLDFSWIAWTPWIAAIGCWTTLGLEVGYALFMWPKRTRKWWGLAMISMHAGISLTMGLHAFAGIMILLTGLRMAGPVRTTFSGVAEQLEATLAEQRKHGRRAMTHSAEQCRADASPPAGAQGCADAGRVPRRTVPRRDATAARLREMIPSPYSSPVTRTRATDFGRTPLALRPTTPLTS